MKATTKQTPATVLNAGHNALNDTLEMPAMSENMARVVLEAQVCQTLVRAPSTRRRSLSCRPALSSIRFGL